MFEVNTIGYCGMRVPHGDGYTEHEARRRVARRMRYLLEQGCSITCIGHYEWEVGEPEGCVMVPDFCGYLKITERKDDDNDCDCDG